jgi:PAS domain S-box-containing protein
MATSDRAIGVVPERALRAALDGLPLAVVVVDARERALYANRLAARLLGGGLELGEKVPWARPDPQPADAAAPHGEVSARDARAGEAKGAIVAGAGGTLRPTTVALDARDGLRLVVLTTVTRAGERSRERDPAQRLQEVEALAQIGSWSWDVEADVVTWSDETYRGYGLAPQSVPVNYAGYLERVHPDDRARVAGIVERCYRTGEGYTMNLRIVLPDGSVRWQQGRGQAVIVDGRVVRMFGTAQDVTERVQREQALRDSLDEAHRLAAENDALRAEIEGQLREVRASRSRIVQAAVDARARLERDLHDGAQQRLVTLGLILRSAQGRLGAGADPALTETLRHAVEELQAGLGELRALARGLHPAILSDQGLVPALRALVARCPVPVKLLDGPIGRLAAPIETAAYFFVSEALANVVKHATASSARVSVELRDGTLIVEVTDDGSGGASIQTGGGLRGLGDRVAAVDGRLELDSPPLGGTRLHAELPCA